MTERLRGVDLPRPEPAADKGPLDTRFYDLVEARVRRVFVDNPVHASLFGIHTEDHRLGDGSRDAVLQEIADDRARSTTCASRCSMPTRSAAGSAPAPPPAPSATRCSSCSPAVPIRSASAWSASPIASRPSPTSSTARGPGSSARRSGSGRRSRRATPGTCPACSATCSRPPRRRSRPRSSPGCAARSRRRTRASTTTAAG